MRISSLTDVGMSREMNQDYLYTSEDAVGLLDNLFIIADGMGGHNAGEYASRKAIEMIVSSIRKYSGPETDAIVLLRNAIKTANDFIRKKASGDLMYHGMGTTVVAAVISDGKLITANVGDSRLYLVNDSIHQITQDHSLVQEMVRLGELTEEEAVNHPDKNIITRAVGAAEEIEVDFFEADVKQGDYILLCSDGLSNMVNNATIHEVLTGEGSVADKTEKLLSLANRYGGKDNITLIVIEV